MNNETLRAVGAAVLILITVLIVDSLDPRSDWRIWIAVVAAAGLAIAISMVILSFPPFKRKR